MSARLHGRRVVVTGASRGIGAGIAERIAAEGADVVLVARTLDARPDIPGSLEATRAHIEHFGGYVGLVVADLADEEDRARIVPEAVEQLGGPIEVLVNNAAAAIYGLPSTYSPKRRRISFEVNVGAPLDLAQAVIPGMVAAGEGWIVNLSSRSAVHAPGPPFVQTGLASTIGMYGASKAALNRATNALAHELWGTGVRVNTVEPRAAVMSEGAEALAAHVIREDQKESMEEMVESVLFLCDCDADHTGAVHVSLELLAAEGVTVMTLDGARPWRPTK